MRKKEQLRQKVMSLQKETVKNLDQAQLREPAGGVFFTRNSPCKPTESAAVSICCD